MTASPFAQATFQRLKAGLDARAGGRVVAAVEHPFRSGFAALDQALGGGFPRGAVAALEGAPSSGRTAIAACMLAQATREALAAVVDDGSLFPPALEAAGADLARILVVSAERPAQVARCADILLRSRSFAVVAVPAVPLRGVVWSRLCGLTQKSGAVLLASGAHAGTELAYFATTRVRCGIERVRWSERAGVLTELEGYEVRAHVLKHRRAAPGATAQLRAVAV